ncbi:MAG: hypothetical protein ACLTBV_13615 [Enterocloster bolteae]
MSTTPMGSLLPGITRQRRHADHHPGGHVARHLSSPRTAMQLNMWIAGCEAAEEVAEIFYGADVPEEYQSGGA